MLIVFSVFQILARADQAMQQRLGQNVSLSSHETEVKSFAQYLTTLMTRIPEGQKWIDYNQQVLALTMECSSRRCLQQQQYFYQPQQYFQQQQQQNPQQQPQQFHPQLLQYTRQPVTLQSEQSATSTTTTLTPVTKVSACLNSSLGPLLNFPGSEFLASKTSTPTNTT